MPLSRVGRNEGSLQNVAKRVLEAAQEFGVHAFVRVSGGQSLD